MEHPVLDSHNTDVHSDKSRSDDVKTLARRLSRSRDPVIARRSRRKTITFIVTIIVVVLSFFGWQAYRPQSVEVTIVSYQRAGAASHPILRQSGFVTYPRIVTVGSSSSEIINKIYFEEGDVVKRGDILAAFEMETLQAQKTIHETAVMDARQTLTRTQNLYAAGAVSSIELQQAEIRLKTAEAQVELMNARIESAYIRAPFSGRILEQLADVGEHSLAGICVLVDNSKILIEFDISQDDLSLLRKEQPALVVLDAYPETEYAGKLSNMSPMANRTTNTIQAEITLLEPDERILQNMSARIYLVKEEQTKNVRVHSVLAVDQSAIFQESSAYYVWIVEDDRVHVRRVETGSSLREDEIEIIEGLKGDDMVIKQPSNYTLKEGTRIVLVQ